MLHVCMSVGCLWARVGSRGIRRPVPLLDVSHDVPAVEQPIQADNMNVVLFVNLQKETVIVGKWRLVGILSMVAMYFQSHRQRVPGKPDLCAYTSKNF
jgi:hypothetical protein